MNVWRREESYHFISHHSHHCSSSPCPSSPAAPSAAMDASLLSPSTSSPFLPFLHATLPRITSRKQSFSTLQPFLPLPYNKPNNHLFVPSLSRRRIPFSLLSAKASTSTMRETRPSEDVDSEGDARVVQIHTQEQFQQALINAESKLVVVEYAASHSANSRRIYPSMVELSRTCQDVVFLLIMGDESDETKEMCKRAAIEKVPHFVFYKNKEVIHEEEGILPDQLIGDVLYYGDTDAPILQLHGREDVEALLAKHAADDKLVVLDVGLKHCGPCVKVYPTFVKLAKKMRETTVFARMNGDENEDCMEFLKQMDVIEVPTFLFIRDGKICGRYVGSGKGELIGEILKYQGVRVT